MTGTTFVDLFCGAGGLSVGFETAGFRPVFANDYDKFACATYRANHLSTDVFCGDVRELTGAQILDSAGHAHIPLVIGGPNCQGVSLRGKRNPDDPKNDMFFHFRRLIDELRPEWFVMENVPGLLHRHNHGLISGILRSFHEIGYATGGEVMLAADYGVPQLRYRFVLIGNRVGKPILFPDPTHRAPIEDFVEQPELFQPGVKPIWLGVREAIGDLPPIPNGGGESEADYPESGNLTAYQAQARYGSTALLNHVAHKSPESNIKYIKHIPPGGNWKWIPEDIRPPRFQHVALKDHTTTYRRLEWEKPARTVTTYSNNISAGAFTHPEQHRGLSVREGARLQGFPDRFSFVGPLARQYRQVGNAVPPLMAGFVAEVVRDLLAGREPSSATHEPAVEYCETTSAVRYNRPVKGMRFNLDRYLVVS
jgi:DNA (cytosine-5)-methyltransferase 1